MKETRKESDGRGLVFSFRKTRKNEKERERERRPVAAETLKGRSVFAQCVCVGV